FLVASFGEYFCYLLARNHSVRLVPYSDRSKFLRVLIVADPQIIGFNDAIFPINYLNMIDSDRFLRNSFHFAFTHDKPDMVIFLGDIFDEGHIAIDSQYKQYIERFRSIFSMRSTIVKVHVPGDNDLGGGDSIDLYSDDRSLKFDRFTNDRKQFSRLSFDFIDLVKVSQSDTNSLLEQLYYVVTQ
uniref:Calcineurin-like phosphoesterase domain-containing protein n=1 Tax=Romanomermis culicivorax TaxID=13658 RepID=A0A915IVZ1_ROMCU